MLDMTHQVQGESVVGEHNDEEHQVDKQVEHVRN